MRHCGVLFVQAKPVPLRGIGPYRTSDVLEVLLAQIGELDIDFAADLIIGRSRDADATGFGDACQPCRDIDAVAENVVTLDQDVAEVDPDPEGDALVLGDIRIAVDGALVEFPSVVDAVRMLHPTAILVTKP